MIESIYSVNNRKEVTHMADRDWSTVKQAQTHYGVTRQRIQQLIKKGAFGECVRVDTPVGHYWLIPLPYQRGAAQTGRPKREN